MKLPTLATIFGLLAVSTGGSWAEEFKAEPAAQAVVSEVMAAAGQSERECALQCESLRFGCAATAFVPETKLCLLSAAWNAEFPGAAGSSVFRKRSAARLCSGTVSVNGKVHCVIQQRSNGSLSFARNWTEYEVGFGDAADFWIGLRSIHELTGSSPRLLRVEAVPWSGVLFVSEYSGFSVGNASTNYTMTFASYLNGSSNTTSDQLYTINGMQFSTMDRDNDAWNGSCSQTHGGSGGWWFKSCAYCHPNGIYFNVRKYGQSGLHWFSADEYNSLQSIRLMLQL